ncbi:hypothetical protein ACO0LF_18090 [Undibacterium sp. Di27W]
MQTWGIDCKGVAAGLSLSVGGVRKTKKLTTEKCMRMEEGNPGMACTIPRDVRGLGKVKMVRYNAPYK